jgi:hypothetical protein
MKAMMYNNTILEFRASCDGRSDVSPSPGDKSIALIIYTTTFI